MTKRLMMLAMLAVALGARAATETVGDYTWTYRINGDTAKINNDWSAAISPSPTGTVAIPSTLGGKPVTSIGEGAFNGCSGLTSVAIPDSVTSIGVFAFCGCSGLTSVTVPDSVTSIGDYAFSGCSGLTSIMIPDSVEYVGQGAFNGCGGLLSISVGAGNPCYSSTNGLLLSKDGMTLIRGVNGDVTIPDGVMCIESEAFSACSRLTSVTIPDSVTLIGDFSFEGCSALTSVTIPNSVESVGRGVFNGCSGLLWISVGAENLCYSSTNGLLLSKDGMILIQGVNGDVTVPDSVTLIGDSAFSGCSGLTSVTIPNSVTHIGCQAFSSCSGLTSVTIPDSVTSIECDAFFGCSGLTSVTIPNNVTSIGASAFYGCSGLTSVTIPDSVTNIDSYAFYGCSALTSVTMSNNITSIGDGAFAGCCDLTNMVVPQCACYSGMSWLKIFRESREIVYYDDYEYPPRFYFDDGYIYCDYCEYGNWICGTQLNSSLTNLNTIVLADGVTSIGDYVFANLSSLKNVTIPNSVTSIGSDAFYGCTGLTCVYITDLAKWCDISFGESYANPLYFAHSLYLNGEEVTALTIPDGVTSIGFRAFYGCSGLTSLTMPNSVRSIGWEAFYGCSGLTSVTIPPSVTNISSTAFHGCSGLLSISVGEGNSCYRSDNGLLLSQDGTTLIMGVNGDVTIPNSVTSIGDCAFYGCSGLTSVTIPNSVTHIGGQAFSSCSGLTSVTIPDSVTSIGWNAFGGCSGLTSVTIPGGVMDVPSYVFCGCMNLREVMIMEGVTSIGRQTFACCFNLEKLVLPNSITHIEAEYVAAGILVYGVTASGAWLGYDSKGDSPFSGCTNLMDVTLPAYVCSTNLAVIFPDSWQSITNVVVNEGVTCLPNGLFWNCTGLQSVTIPSSVTRLGSSIDLYNMSGNMHGVFEDCASLKSITFMGDAPDMGDDVFLGTPRSLVAYVQPGSIGWDGGVSTGLPLSWNGRGIAYADGSGTGGGSSGGSGSGGGSSGGSASAEDPRYALTDHATDRAIASVTVDGDCAIDEFVLKDGKVYDCVLRIVNTAEREVTLSLPEGYEYESFKGAKPLRIPANSRNILTITRTADTTFLVSREELEPVQ